MEIYPNIDMKKTGARIEKMIKKAGFDVKTIQKHLQLSCPQPIYRWFKGKVLPTVNHLYALSVILGVHIEDLLVPQDEEILLFCMKTTNNQKYKRQLFYFQKACQYFGLFVQ